MVSGSYTLECTELIFGRLRKLVRHYVFWTQQRLAYLSMAMIFRRYMLLIYLSRAIGNPFNSSALSKLMPLCFYLRTSGDILPWHSLAARVYVCFNKIQGFGAENK